MNFGVGFLFVSVISIPVTNGNPIVTGRGNGEEGKKEGRPSAQGNVFDERYGAD
jgi:hypothetical protein